MPITGGCLCKQLRYEIASDAPLLARQCWCRVCQYLGAGTGTANAVFLEADIAITGESRAYTSLADSGSVMHRSFCPSCGTPVFSVAETRPHHIVVRVGTFDDPELGKPSAIIWATAAPAWACFDPALPKAEGQGPAPK